MGSSRSPPARRATTPRTASRARTGGSRTRHRRPARRRGGFTTAEPRKGLWRSRPAPRCRSLATAFTDQETGTRTAIDSGGAAQWDGELSPDGRWFIWVDYRDPPGRSSDYDKRNGGEVYLRDLVAGTTTRLTHDSPDAPRAKTYPSSDGKLAVWNEIPDGLDPNPSSNTAVYGNSTTLVVLDISSSKKCRLDLGISNMLERMSVHGRHVYGYYGSITDGRAHLADLDLDLDDPGLAWTCK